MEKEKKIYQNGDEKYFSDPECKKPLVYEADGVFFDPVTEEEFPLDEYEIIKV